MGNRLPTVLPMPVGACASKPQPRLLALYMASASWRWPGRKSAWGKAMAAELRIAAGAVRHFLLGPVEEQRAMLFEEQAQRLGRALLVHDGFLLADDIEIHERHAQHGQVQLLAQQVAVDARLRPVQLAVVGGHGVQVAPVGLDFFQLAPRRVVAIGAAPHVQGAEVAGTG